jgi:hypothetical protein
MSESTMMHPRTIVHGRGVVVYIDGHNFQPSGWYLPGGQYTHSAEEAGRAARIMHDLIMANAAYEGTGFVGRSARA